MGSLKSNFLTEYRDIKQKIEQVKKIIPEVIKVFVDFFIHEKGGEGQWPYEIIDCRLGQKNGKPKLKQKPPSYSASTNSMIMFTLGILSGLIQESPLVPKIRIPVYTDGIDVLTVLRKAFKRLAKHKPQPKNIPFNKDMITWSFTFGFNDPFTLGWFLELINAMPHIFEELKIPNPREKFLKEARKLIKKSAAVPVNPIFDWRGERILSRQPEHVFPLLKIVQLLHIIRHFNEDPGINVEKIHRCFNDCIHRHLSYSSITDIGFDAAELMFSLEGSFLCKPEAFNEVLLNRVFEILNERQKESPYWQPTKPLVASPQGEVLMPLSVEIANSLLRISTYLEKGGLHESYISTSIDLFKRYEEWLRSRMVRGIAPIPFRKQNETQKFIGWQSEYIPRPGTIHLWETSQVLLFLSYYIAMLEKYIARTSLDHANLSIKILGTQEDDPKAYWDSIEQRYEPLKNFNDDSEYRIYRRIAEHYIAPRISYTKTEPVIREMNYSMLIYGPPGTAKTTIARELSKTLGYPLIEITPSDFIAGGEAEVEARAKSIFQTLQEQSEVVIFFDEIDRMILDRDSNLYREQSDVFQFMTPGVLTKFKDLRDKKKSILIIATNYSERIDKAIKRKGRIDDLYLLLPPNKEQRYNIFKYLLNKYCGHLGPISDTRLRSLLGDTINKTALFVYDELNQLIHDSLPAIDIRQGDKWFKELKFSLSKNINKIQPIVSLGTYYNRFKATADKPEEKFPTAQEPFEEFLILVYLVLEVNGDLVQEDKVKVEKIVKFVKEEKDAPLRDVCRPKEFILDHCLKHVRDNKVKDYLMEKFIQWKWCE
jgi:cytidylate kinase